MRGFVQFLRGWRFRLAGTGAGVLFGVFGWRLARSAEVAWYLLIYYPALIVSQLLHLGHDDRAALTATVLLHGTLGFLTGWAADSIWRRLIRRRSAAARRVHRDARGPEGAPHETPHSRPVHRLPRCPPNSA